MRYVCVHGHFYQPCREDPFTGEIPVESSAYPHDNWNERILAQCYGPNTAARLLDSTGAVRGFRNNYASLSFNVGPTLLDWLERHSPKVYEQILCADRQSGERCGGHGAAMAQPAHHSILPLCDPRDKITEIRWGIDNFVRHFSRPPEGMWLPETAVDVATLEALAAQEILFTVLAPGQARAFRGPDTSEWTSITDEPIDCSRPYRVPLPSGRSIVVFFYDGLIANQVAFKGLLRSGDEFAGALRDAAPASQERDPRLLSVATDGESYGHHHPHGEMALARAIEVLEEDPSVELIHYGAFLAAHGPTWEASIVEESSWSCCHGVERWRAHCGCAFDPVASPSQHWRAPMRATLDWVKESVNRDCSTVAQQLFGDPFAARDASLGDWQRHLREPGDPAAREAAQGWLEVQKSLLRMYTSCGWFFGDLNRIEPIKNLQVALKALRRSRELSGKDREDEFMERLQSIPSGKADGISALRCVQGDDHEVVGATQTRSAGVLMHLTSLRGGWGVGDMGEGARAFVDWLVEAGVSLWQVLPVNPVDAEGCPYSSWADCAGEPMLIDLEALVAGGLLDHAAPPSGVEAAESVDFVGVKVLKGALLSQAAKRFLSLKDHRWLAEFEAFCKDAEWLDDFALFGVLRDLHGGGAWWDWPPCYRDRDPGSLEALRREHREAFEVQRVTQFFFERQWQGLRRYCNERGVTLLGDLPIYVSGESVDVWANQTQFLLNAQGQPSVVSGVPPDPFCVDGQLWANPIYDWKAMREDGYRWWKRRFERAFARTDVVRVDHFRGFSAYWEVPAEAETAGEGQWVKGPGEELFTELRAHFAEFPIVVEDLGDIDEPVRELVRAVGAPGMRVLSFAFNGDADSEHLPIHYDPNVVCYTGTHDTNTLLGWWSDVDDVTRDHVRRFLGIDGHDVVWDLIRAAMSSVANWAVVPMQDLLALDGEARMNVPGTVTGNWCWRLPGHEPAASVAHRLHDLIDLYGRSAPR